MTEINNEWICTDEDNEQYARVVSEKVFDFKEKNHLNGLNDEGDWIEMTIDLDEYDENSMYDQVCAYYGYGDFKQMLEDKEYLVIAECIFEQESGLY